MQEDESESEASPLLPVAEPGQGRATRIVALDLLRVYTFLVYLIGIDYDI
jgi:hypothetical protein